MCWDYEKQGNKVEIPDSFSLIYFSFIHSLNEIIIEYIAYARSMLRARDIVASNVQL